MVHRKAKVAGKLQISQEHRGKYALEMDKWGKLKQGALTKHATEWLTQSETVGLDCGMADDEDILSYSCTHTS